MSVVARRPLGCAHCGTLLLGDDSQPERHQVTELTRIEPRVTEYQRHTPHRLNCGEATTAEWPRVQATSAYLSGLCPEPL